MTGDDRPRPRALLTAAGLGLAVGIGIASVTLAVVREDEVPDPAPTSTSTVAAAPTTTQPRVWVHPREVVIGATALVPTDLAVESGELTLSYDLLSIAPSLTEGEDEDDGDEAVALVFPTGWTAVTSAGEFAGSTPIIDARRARFTVPDDLTVADIRSIRLDAYRVPVPFSFALPIEVGDPTPHEILPGMTAQVVSVLQQRENAIVTVALAADDGFLVSDIVVSGRTHEWVRASRSQLGRQTWTLDYRGPVLPDPLPLQAHGILWPEIEHSMDVDVAGLGE